MSAEYILPKGSKVLHGTCMNNLQTILSLGLQPGHSRHELRELTEAEPEKKPFMLVAPRLTLVPGPPLAHFFRSTHKANPPWGS